ncbi:MAG: glycosyltransferase family 4 protein [Cyclobacteriaceae bacterium]
MNILFVSNNDSKTGAPLYLFSLIKWLVNNTDVRAYISFASLVRQGQSLHDEFLKYAKSIDPLIEQELQNSSLSIRIIRKLKTIVTGKLTNPYIEFLQDIDLIYVNTFTNGEFLDMILQGRNIPILTHVHELTHNIGRCNSRRSIQLLLKHTNEYIAVSNAVSLNLRNSYSIDSEQVRVLNPVIPRVLRVRKSRSQLRSMLGIGQGDFVVLGLGYQHWIKGTDIFFQIALNYVRYLKQDIVFLWVGGNVDDEYYKMTKTDIEKANMDSHFKVVPHVDNPLDFINASDVLLCTSREDSYPLSALEAKSLGKPVCFFKNSGGVEEMFDSLENGVDYLDVRAMTSLILKHHNATGDSASTVLTNIDTENESKSHYNNIYQAMSQTLKMQ